MLQLDVQRIVTRTGCRVDNLHGSHRVHSLYEVELSPSPWEHGTLSPRQRFPQLPGSYLSLLFHWGLYFPMKYASSLRATSAAS